MRHVHGRKARAEFTSDFGWRSAGRICTATCDSSSAAHAGGARDDGPRHAISGSLGSGAGWLNAEGKFTMVASRV